MPSTEAGPSAEAGTPGTARRPPAIRLLDTTLRDGTGSGAFAPSADARRTIALALAGAGIDAIELASSDAEDVEALCALAGELADVEVCVIGPATSDAVAKALALLAEARSPRIHLYADVERPDGLSRALEAVFAARVNVDRVEFSPLRAFETEPDAVVEIAVAVSDSGASAVNLSDTRGEATPDDVARLIGRVAARLGGTCTTSFHGHDHAGRAVANALAACEAGARQIHVCVGGVGPQGGNTPLEGLVAAIDARGTGAPARARIDRTALGRLGDLVARATG